MCESFGTLLALQHLFKKATESIVPHFTNKKTEAWSKKISSQGLSPYGAQEVLEFTM